MRRRTIATSRMRKYQANESEKKKKFNLILINIFCTLRNLFDCFCKQQPVLIMFMYVREAPSRSLLRGIITEPVCLSIYLFHSVCEMCIRDRIIIVY